MAESRNLTLEQFKAQPSQRDWERLFSKIGGGTFVQCHERIFKEHGIWIEELTPVFLKLDSLTASK